METKIQVFENGNLGMVRVIEVKGEPMFVGADAATLLGYQNQGMRSLNTWMKKIKLPSRFTTVARIEMLLL